jgi:hypothetical protein
LPTVSWAGAVDFGGGACGLFPTPIRFIAPAAREAPRQLLALPEGDPASVMRFKR